MNTFNINELSDQLIQAIKRFNLQGKNLATSSNYSFRHPSTNQIIITSSGIDKASISAQDLMTVTLEGKTLEGENRSPSAETLLHTQLYENPAIGCVVHNHSLNSIILSAHHFNQKIIEFENLEILKAFTGQSTHQTKLIFPIFENTQDIAQLAGQVRDYLKIHPQTYGYYIHGHGIYSWGPNIPTAIRHLEALEYLTDYKLQMR